MEKILHLTLKKKWFDMIAAGEKKEEYREIKMYWWKRLVECGQCYKGYEDGVGDLAEELLPVSQWKMILAQKFDHVVFKNGYRKNSPSLTVEFLNIEIGKPISGLCEEGYLDTNVFVIKLGNILTHP